MSTRPVTAAARVMGAAMVRGQTTATQLAVALDSAQLLMSPEKAAEFERLRKRVAELEAAQGTVFRASHDSIAMGLYTTREAAMGHVHATLANEEGGDVTARVIWRADDPEADEPEWECWLFDTDMADDSPTGYIVSPLEVASEYDEEADE